MGKSLIFLSFLLACSPESLEVNDILSAVCEDTQIENKDANKTYILLGSEDNLKDDDVEIFDIGLYCLGFTPKSVNVTTTLYDLPAYLSEDVYLLYFSGHGSYTGIFVGDDGFYFGYNDLKINAQYIIFSTCNVLRDEELVRNFIGESTKYIMGYYDKMYDNIDNNMIYNMLLHIKAGKTIPMAFYLANKNEEFIENYWVIYKNENEKLIEYSTRSGNKYTE